MTSPRRAFLGVVSSVVSLFIVGYVVIVYCCCELVNGLAFLMERVNVVLVVLFILEIVDEEIYFTIFSSRLIAVGAVNKLYRGS